MRRFGTFPSLALRAVAVALALLAAAPGAHGQEPDKAIVDAWVKAGAQYAWVKPLGFRPAFTGARRDDELPGFNLGNQVGLLPTLPVIATPFGLVVAGPLDAAAINAIARQRALRLLDLEKSTVKDADLGALAGLRLAHFALPVSARTDVALRHFLAARAPGPTLDLYRWQVTDAAMGEIAALRSLESLGLGGTKVTDAGMKPLAALAGLTSLDLRFTTLTDAGLRELAPLRRLQALNLHSTRVTDAGMKDVAGFVELRSLILGGTRVSDSGLADIAGLGRLQELDLWRTAVTDAGMKHLARLTQLQSLRFGDTKVTEAGIKELAALPLKSLDRPKPAAATAAAPVGPPALGVGSTRCEGEACASVALVWEAGCVLIVNRGARAIRTDYVIHGGSTADTVAPSGRVRMASPMGCQREQGAVGLYRAAWAAAGATASTSADAVAASGDECRWRISAQGVFGYADLVKPPGAAAPAGTIEMRIEYQSGWKEYHGKLLVIQDAASGSILGGSRTPVAIAVDGAQVARFVPGDLRDSRDLTAIFGAGLLKLREARTLEVTMFPEGRAEKVLSCRLPDMHQTFAAIEKEAASPRPR